MFGRGFWAAIKLDVNKIMLLAKIITSRPAQGGAHVQATHSRYGPHCPSCSPSQVASRSGLPPEDQAHCFRSRDTPVLDMDEREISAFQTHHAAEKHVAPLAQNQAFSTMISESRRGRRSHGGRMAIAAGAPLPGFRSAAVGVFWGNIEAGVFEPCGCFWSRTMRR